MTRNRPQRAHTSPPGGCASFAKARRLIVLSGSFILIVAGGALAEQPDWAAAADTEVIIALTEDEDGGARETKIWLAVLDGAGYIRTSQSSTWGGNVERNSDIMLRIETTEYPVHITFIEDDALRARVVAAFSEKYGWSDRWLDFIRGSRPRIMQVGPREASAS